MPKANRAVIFTQPDAKNINKISFFCADPDVIERVEFSIRRNIRDNGILTSLFKFKDLTLDISLNKIDIICTRPNALHPKTLLQYFNELAITYRSETRQNNPPPKKIRKAKKENNNASSDCIVVKAVTPVRNQTSDSEIYAQLNEQAQKLDAQVRKTAQDLNHQLDDREAKLKEMEARLIEKDAALREKEAQLVKEKELQVEKEKEAQLLREKEMQLMLEKEAELKKNKAQIEKEKQAQLMRDKETELKEKEVQRIIEKELEKEDQLSKWAEKIRKEKSQLTRKKTNFLNQKVELYWKEAELNLKEVQLLEQEIQFLNQSKCPQVDEANYEQSFNGETEDLGLAYESAPMLTQEPLTCIQSLPQTQETQESSNENSNTGDDKMLDQPMIEDLALTESEISTLNSTLFSQTQTDFNFFAPSQDWEDTHPNTASKHASMQRYRPY